MEIRLLRYKSERVDRLQGQLRVEFVCCLIVQFRKNDEIRSKLNTIEAIVSAANGQQIEIASNRDALSLISKQMF